MSNNPKEAKSKTIVCLGAGYAGGSTICIMASHCPKDKFYVCDIKKSLVDSWNCGRVPFYEPGLQSFLSKTHEKNLWFSTVNEKLLAEANVIFIVVPTPFDKSKREPSLQYYRRAAHMIKSACQNSLSRKIVVEKSTVPLGTGKELCQILNGHRDQQTSDQFVIVSNPEFLSEGNAVADLENPDRVLIGIADSDLFQPELETVKSIYRQWIPEESIFSLKTGSSELGKLVSNAMLAQRLSSINSLTKICEIGGADLEEVKSVVQADHRIGKFFLNPSIGFGGSCLEKDTLMLAYVARCMELDEVAEYWESVIKINNMQRNRFVKTILKQFPDGVKDVTFTLFGMAFKKDTNDTRESSGLYIAHDLLLQGATLNIYDPMVTQEHFLTAMEEFHFRQGVSFADQINWCQSPQNSIKNSSAIVVITEWDCFKEYNYQKFFDMMTERPIVFDGRNIMDRSTLREIGFKVYSLGTGF